MKTAYFGEVDTENFYLVRYFDIVSKHYLDGRIRNKQAFLQANENRAKLREIEPPCRYGRLVLCSWNTYETIFDEGLTLLGKDTVMESFDREFCFLSKL